MSLSEVLNNMKTYAFDSDVKMHEEINIINAAADEFKLLLNVVASAQSRLHSSYNKKMDAMIETGTVQRLKEEQGEPQEQTRKYASWIQRNASSCHFYFILFKNVKCFG